MVSSCAFVFFVASCFWCGIPCCHGGNFGKAQGVFKGYLIDFHCHQRCACFCVKLELFFITTNYSK